MINQLQLLTILCLIQVLNNARSLYDPKLKFFEDPKDIKDNIKGISSPGKGFAVLAYKEARKDNFNKLGINASPFPFAIKVFDKKYLESIRPKGVFISYSSPGHAPYDLAVFYKPKESKVTKKKIDKPKEVKHSEKKAEDSEAPKKDKKKKAKVIKIDLDN